jgi:hypothetical protein
MSSISVSTSIFEVGAQIATTTHTLPYSRRVFALVSVRDDRDVNHNIGTFQRLGSL